MNAITVKPWTLARSLRRAPGPMAALLIAASGMGGCSMLGLSDPEASAQSAPTRPASTAAKSALPKRGSQAATPRPASADALQARSTDMQNMLEALDKLSGTPGAASATVEPTLPPAPARPAPPARTSQASTKSAEPGEVALPPMRTPTLVASTIAIADENAALEAAERPAPETSSSKPTSGPVERASNPEAPSTSKAPHEAPSAATTPAPSGPTPAAAPAPTPAAPAAAAAESRLEISTLALCQRVESFGRYTPLTSSTFLAGRSAQMILYTELAGFTQRPDSSGDSQQFVTELSQTVELFLDSDGSKQFVVPTQSVRELSRSPRRDFYLVQRIELPRTLSVGRYNLKVRVTDLASGQESERSQRINIVADPSARSENPPKLTPKPAATPRVVSGEEAR